MVEYASWLIREQYLVVCNIAKWTVLCIVVHFQPVIKLLQKDVRVHHRRVILMQKCTFFQGGEQPAPQIPPQWGGGHPLPTHHPLGASILTHPIRKFCLRYCCIKGCLRYIDIDVISTSANAISTHLYCIFYVLYFIILWQHENVNMKLYSCISCL